MGALFEQGDAALLPHPNQSGQSIAAAPFPKEFSDSVTQSEVLDLFFGEGSGFGPQLKNEFLARCHDSSPSAALKSLAEDLFGRPPQPLLYSRLPIEQIPHEVINPKTDLLLSHIELAQARGLRRYQFSSLSEAADRYYAARGSALSLRARYAVLKHTLEREIDKRQSAIRAIEFDRARFEEPERLKRNGDLILANLANARVDGSRVTVVDYYASDQGEIEIEIPAGASLTEAASIYFSRYQKARRALAAIDSRAHEVSEKLDPLRHLLGKLEHDPASETIEEVSEAAGRLLGTTRGGQRGMEKRAKDKDRNSFGRKFRSSDGYEIVVGRNNRDNDGLTFRVAKPNDIWLHAADYPGSHTLIRNPARFALPHRTITEAAELAAFYSQAKREGKAAIHYTQKKFVSKPPRSKPGLVRLSSFKTIVVEPKCKLERIE
jgi:predicted ribosome quality control (RQC) complex YloA/Tae2 family protein